MKMRHHRKRQAAKGYRRDNNKGMKLWDHIKMLLVSAEKAILILSKALTGIKANPPRVRVPPFHVKSLSFGSLRPRDQAEREELHRLKKQMKSPHKP